MEKRRNCSLGAILLFSTIFYYLLLDFNVKTGTRFSLRDKRLLEISGVDITRFDYSIEICPGKATVTGVSLSYIMGPGGRAN